jgi:multidrug efflux pump subunit AcrA (membrane-fusion protein)
MRVLKFVLPLIILSIGFGGFTYLKSNKKESEPLIQKDRAPIVSVQNIEIVNATPTIKLFGQVETPNISSLTAVIEADVLAVSILEGDSVTKAQQLITLDNTDVILEIAQRQSELTEIEALIDSEKIRLASDKNALLIEKELLALTRRAVARARKLAVSQSGSEATVDEALQNEQRQILALTSRELSIRGFDSRLSQLKARLSKADAILKKALRDKDRSIVTAPYSGRVTQVLISVGDRVNRGEKLLEIYDDTQLELRAQIPSFYTPILQNALKNNLSVIASAENYEHKLVLNLHRMSASVSSGQGGVDGFFRTRTNNLPALGVTLEINLELPELKQVVLISPDSLYNQDSVYVIEQGLLAAKAVKRLGQLTDSENRQVIIVRGESLRKGDALLVSRLPQAISGLQVKVAE